MNPPWWRTDLAYGGYFFGFIGVVTAAVRLRAREQRKRALLLEQLVARRTAQLLRASEAKTEFVTAMSHDVRTPINGILGTTIELSRSHLDANQRILVKRLEACSDMLGSLVEHVLDFAAIESGQTVIADSPFSPAGLLDSVRTILRASAPQSDYLIESEIDADLPGWISGDEDRIRQIMVNYESNAVKYAGANVIKLRVRRDDNFAIFSVADRGPGISEEAQKRLFVRFSRITPAAGKEGKGLGLAGCRVIARLMNGTVGVASHVGAGAEFWLRVPMRESSLGEIFDGSRPQVMCGQRARLVEDIPFSAEASRSVLEAVGLEVEVVCTGHAAIERVQLDRFDLVFLDVNLPDLPGMEVASRIRSLGGEGPPIKILATTAHSTVDHKAECIRSGMTGFISKPLTPEKVRRGLTRADISSLLEETGASRASFAMLEFLSKGSPAELRMHTDRLLSGVAGEMTALSAASSKEDRDEIGRTAHRLITYARLASDQKLIELAARLELTAPVASMDSIGEQIFKIRSGIALVRSKLEDHARQAGFA